MGLLKVFKTMHTDAVKCDWCGRYIKSLDVDNSILAASSISHIFYGVKKNYCSTACKLAAQEAKAGTKGGVKAGSSSSNVGKASDNSGKKAFGGMLGSLVNEELASLADEKKEKAKKDAECKEISEMDISGTPEEIQDILGKLVSKAVGLTGFFKSSDEKKMLNIIKEKIEFGVMKLNSMGASAEAEFFQKKLDNLK